jgi:hypothetical protein
VNPFILFVLRALLGLGIAFLLMRIFHPAAPAWVTVLLAAALVGFAYVLETLRKRKRDGAS